MALTRYLHFQFSLGPTGITALRAVEVYDAGGIDLTIAVGTTGVVAASSEYPSSDASYVKEHAFDHLNHTNNQVWAAAAGDPGWLRYDLGATADVRSVIIRGRADITGQTPTAAIVYGSMTGFPTGLTSAAYAMDRLSEYTLTDASLGAATTIAVPASTLSPSTGTSPVHVTDEAAAKSFKLSTLLGPWTDKVIRTRVSRAVDFKVSFGGRGYLSGHTYVTGTPNTPDPFIRVGLYKESGALVASTFSDASGFYRFDGLDASIRYFVVSFDDAHDYNAVVKDNLVPMV